MNIEKIDYETKLFGLIGNPTQNTLSPFIHNSIFKYEDLNYRYLNFNTESSKFKDSVDAFKALNFKGFNVTIPYKISILNFLDGLTELAKKVGAVNTVKIIDNKLIGHNTDGLGFIKTFEDANISIKGFNVLLLGAGGAAYSVGYSLLENDIESLSILNRTYEKGLILKNKLMESTTRPISVIQSESSLSKDKYDLVVNTSSVGMAPLTDESPIELHGFKDDLIVYDIIYKPLETKLLKEANSSGYRTFNGLNMLVNQAILSQEFWLDYKVSHNTIIKLENDLIGYLK